MLKSVSRRAPRRLLDVVRGRSDPGPAPSVKYSEREIRLLKVFTRVLRITSSPPRVCECEEAAAW
jgi:hypothetical protein